jgi:hypothetical protein
MQKKTERRRNQAWAQAAERASNENRWDEKKIESLVAERRGEQRLQEKGERHESQRAYVDYRMT